MEKWSHDKFRIIVVTFATLWAPAMGQTPCKMLYMEYLFYGQKVENPINRQVSLGTLSGGGGIRNYMYQATEMTSS